MKARKVIGRVLAGVILAGAVTLTSLPAGAVHADGTVDAADYVLWRKTYFQAAPDSNEATGAGGYNIWRACFGCTGQ